MHHQYLINRICVVFTTSGLRTPLIMLNMSETGPVGAESALVFPLFKAGVAPVGKVKISTQTEMSAEVCLKVNTEQKQMKCAGYVS